MKIKYQVGIVVEIPEPVRTKIQKMREELNTPTSKLPVEITIAGSSGVSYIPTGTELTIITEEVDKIASRFKPFSVTFDEINYFQNTSIVYLSPNKRTQFDDLHRAFKESGLNIKKLQFPYTPHCTLRAGEDLSKDDLDEICKMPFPKSVFFIDTISVYDFDENTMECHLLYKKELG